MKQEWNDNGCGGVWRAGKNWMVAHVMAGSGSADMQLILAAPKLLEALRGLCFMLDNPGISEDNKKILRTNAEQAINKAEGGQC